MTVETPLSERSTAWRRAWRIGLSGLAAAATVVVVVQLRDIDLGAVFADVQVSWLVAAILAAAASILAAVHNLSAFAPLRLRLRDSVRAQLAVCGIRVVTPSVVSTPAICARYLNRSGLGAAESLAVVGTAQVAQLVMTAVVMGALALAGLGGLPAPDLRLVLAGVLRSRCWWPSPHCSADAYHGCAPW